jgi:hypothetical protein
VTAAVPKTTFSRTTDRCTVKARHVWTVDDFAHKVKTTRATEGSRIHKVKTTRATDGSRIRTSFVVTGRGLDERVTMVMRK